MFSNRLRSCTILLLVRSGSPGGELGFHVDIEKSNEHVYIYLRGLGLCAESPSVLLDWSCLVFGERNEGLTIELVNALKRLLVPNTDLLFIKRLWLMHVTLDQQPPLKVYMNASEPTQGDTAVYTIESRTTKATHIPMSADARRSL